MKTIFCHIVLLASATNVWAQTNVVSTKPQEIGLHSKHFYYDQKANEAVYYEQVLATNGMGWMTCERLTISLPPQDAPDNHPTNALAETNLVIFFMNKKGETNLLRSDKGIYSYHVINGITNEFFTFSGHATNRNSRGWLTGEPLVWDNVNGRFEPGSNVEMHFTVPTNFGNGTSAKPFGF